MAGLTFPFAITFGQLTRCLQCLLVRSEVQDSREARNDETNTSAVDRACFSHR